VITLLTGENSFEIERELRRIVSQFDGEPERIDGSTIEIRQLPDLLMGVTLFADRRLVIIKGLSENKVVWVDFIDWLPRVSDDIHVVLVESKPDKRTVTYKELKKNAIVRDYPVWSERDSGQAEKWVKQQSESIGLTLDTKSVQQIVRRVGVDQWSLFHALEKLSFVGTITSEIIESTIDAHPSENVFNLFDAALRGDRAKVHNMMRTLEVTQDPFQLLGLLSGQAFQLAAVAVSSPSDDVAKDLGVHPYVISKLSSSAKKQGRAGARRIVAVFAKADDDIKVSRGDPWLIIERTLLQVAT
jgi:DNA polymerase-3 subunit delta